MLDYYTVNANKILSYNQRPIIFQRYLNKDIPVCELNEPIKFCSNIYIAKKNIKIDIQYLNETYPVCSTLICYGVNNVSTNDITFRKISSLKVSDAYEYLVPGHIRNDEFQPIYFEFHSLDEKVIAYKKLCNLFYTKYSRNSIPFSTHQPVFKTFYYLKGYLKSKIFRNILVYKNNQNKFILKKKFFYFMDHQILGITCLEKSLNNSILNWRLVNDNFFLSATTHIHGKNNLDFIGKIQGQIGKDWYQASSLLMDYHQIRVICKHFGYKSGFLYITREYLNDNPSAHFILNCKNAKFLNECKIENFLEEWLNRFYLSNFQIMCTNKEFSKFFFK